MFRMVFSLGAVLLLMTGLAFAQARAEDDFKLEEGFVSLFNGKDLTGWQYKGSKEKLDGKTETEDERIKVENGAIVMMPKNNKGQSNIRDLYTLKTFEKAFHLKLEFRAGLKADSGVYVRGPQLQVRDFIRRGENKHLKLFKNDDWNTLDIVVTNNVLRTLVNGQTLTPKDTFEMTFKDGKATGTLNGKAIDPKNVQVNYANLAVCTINGERLETMSIPAKGGIGLQAESGKFEFRRVRIKELP